MARILVCLKGSSFFPAQVLEMLFNAGSDIDVADERGVGAIHAATIQKNSAMVDWLLTRPLQMLGVSWAWLHNNSRTARAQDSE